LRRNNLLNLFLALLSPTIAAVIVIGCVAQQTIPAAFSIEGLCAVILGMLFVAERLDRLSSPVALVDGARAIDRKLESSDRFMTLASFVRDADDPRYQLLLGQARMRLGSAAVDEIAPFVLDRRARLSLLVFAPLVLIGVLLFRAEEILATNSQKSAQARRVAESAEGVRALANQAATLPSEVREELALVADALEEKGKFDLETLELIESTIRTIDEIEAKLPEMLPDQKDLEKVPPKSDQQREGKKDGGKKPSAENEQQKDEQGANQSEKSLKENRDQKDGGQKDSRDGKKDEAGTGQQQAGQQEGQQDQSGESKETAQAEAAKEGEQKDQAQGDEKKAESGTGEGSGKGSSGKEGTDTGKDQTGQQSQDAKEGDAKNESQAGGGSKSGKGEKGDKGQQANGESAAGEQSGDRQKSEGQGGKSGQSELKEAKDALNDLKQKNQEAAGKGQSPSSKGEQEQGDKGSKPDGKSQAKEGTSKDGKQPNQQDSKGQGSGKEPKDQQQSKSQDGKGKDGDQGKGKEGSAGKEPGEESKAGDPKEGAQQKQGGEPGGAKGESKSSQNEDGSSDGNRDSTQRPTGKPSPLSERSQGAQDLPENGGKGEGVGAQKEGTQVNVPQEEEQITIRHLGAEEKQLYRNNPGTKSRTELGSQEFEKPKAETGKSSQPIPVEYQDLLIE